MKQLKTILIGVIVLLLSSCAAPPTDTELANADYGPYPTEYEQIVKRHLNRVLKDPESAKITILKGPNSGWNALGGRKFGWVVCADVNAKNSYGGYTGTRLSYFMIKNDSVIQYLISDSNPITQGMIESGCGYR